MKSNHFKDLVRWQTVTGQSLNVNGFTLTPQSQVLIIRFPWSAFLWQRPTALLIEGNGQRKRLPLVDLTRLIHLGLWSLGVLILIVRFVQRSRRKEQAS